MKFFDLSRCLGPSVRYAYLRGRVHSEKTLRVAAQQNAIIWFDGVYLGRTFLKPFSLATATQNG